MELIAGSVEALRLSLDEPLRCEHASIVLDMVEDSNVSLRNLVERLEINAQRVASALVVIGLEANGGLGPSLVTQGPLDKRWKPYLAATAWAELLPDLPETDRLVLSAGLLQIFDFWEESHNAAQKADDLGERRLAARWHAICHRREPDAGNAAYWLARAASAAPGDRLAQAIAATLPTLSPRQRKVAEALIARGTFDDRAMIDACVRSRPDPEIETLLRRVQKYEMAFLIASSLERLA